MAQDFADFLRDQPIDDPNFPAKLAQQYTYRNLSELALIGGNGHDAPQTLALANVNSNRSGFDLLPKSTEMLLDKGQIDTKVISNRIEARIAVSPGSHLYIYTSRPIDRTHPIAATAMGISTTTSV